uniref:Peptidase S1 domain-containing protein n=1 Tax=Glossina palpalis gambiensis TaxID=67801 RepID=A0A1B0ARI0_9MUSC
MLFQIKIITFLLIALVICGECVEAMKRKTISINEEQEQLIRQSQSTFAQWVWSLLPQAPTLETIGLSLNDSTITVTEATTTTEAPSSAGIATTTTTTVASSSVVTQTSTSAPPRPPTTPRPELDPPRNCSDCVCGIANTQKRIVGGQETELHQYPWMCMLLYGGRFYCAATLINDLYALTASHCVYGFRRERISVRLLEHDRKMANFQKIDRRVAQVITHPKYNARTYDNDIAIVKLDKPVEMTELLRPVCMPTPGKSFKGEIGIVTGWGALRVGGPSSDTLQEVQVPIMSQDDCRQSRYGPSRITDNMLCAGYEEGSKDSCQGDSGGPLHIVAYGTREHQLAGVVSWGEGCAKAGYPGVYARVNRYGTWIKTMTKNACLCHSEKKKNCALTTEAPADFNLNANPRQTSFLEWLVSIFQPSKEVTTKPPVTAERDCSHQCTCGSRNTINRIVGGHETEVHQYPWMAMLRFRERFICGAWLIDDLHVGSAAHCLRGFTPGLLSVRLLEHSRRNSSAHIIDRKVSQVFVHENYSPRIYDNDIGVLKLDKPITMSDMVRPVCMPEKNREYEHEEAIITGWGATREGGPAAENLQEVRVPILSTKECRESGYGSSRITDNMLCAGISEGGKDSCQGDSGGPLHVAMKDANLHRLVGIVSWGEGCARPNYPGVYTRVNRYLDWIKEKTKDGCKCQEPVNEEK